MTLQRRRRSFRYAVAGLPVAAVLVVTGCSADSGGPFDDLPEGTPLPYGTHYASVFEGNESCVALEERRDDDWYPIAFTTLELGNNEYVYGWETWTRPDDGVQEVSCLASRTLGFWEIRLPELPPGTYRACASGCGEAVVIAEEAGT
jgi:hypothetical protein